MADTDLEPPFQAYAGDAPFIFVSYAHKDSALVFPELERLNLAGYRIWFDEGIDPGNEWPEEVATALDECSQFIVFISPNAVNSRNVGNEIQLAIRRSKPFLAVYLCETELPRGLDLNIGTLQHVMMHRMSSLNYHRKLDKALSKTLRDDVAADRAAALEREQEAESKRKAEEKAAQLAIAKRQAKAEAKAAELAERAKHEEEQRQAAELAEHARLAEEKRKADQEAVRLIEVEQTIQETSLDPKVHKIDGRKFENIYPRSKYGLGIGSRIGAGAIAAVSGLLAFDLAHLAWPIDLPILCMVAIPVLIFGFFAVAFLAGAFGSGESAIVPGALRETKGRAEKGSVNEQFNLGLLYLWKARNYKDAQLWLQKAADAGHGGAQNTLGYVYELGLGGQKDVQKAMSFYRQAAQSGSIYAEQNIKRLELTQFH